MSNKKQKQKVFNNNLNINSKQNDGYQKNEINYLTLTMSEAIPLVDNIELLTNESSLMKDNSQITWLIKAMWNINRFLLASELEHISHPDHQQFHLRCDTKYTISICKLMKLLPNNTELHKNALLSITILCRVKDTKENNILALFENDICSILNKSFEEKCLFESSSVQQWALTAIANLVKKSEDRKEYVFKCDFKDAIFNSLETHSRDPGMC